MNSFRNYLQYYLLILFIFGVFFLYQKHEVGNDSTISEWLINYSGGFTKRGLVGQLSIYLSYFLNLNLRDSILVFQIVIFAIFFVGLFFFLREIKINKLILLSIFTPIFILYPIAEIEVLARKELFIYCIFLLYFIDINLVNKFYYRIFFLPLAMLIYEPVIFFFPFWFSLDIIENKIKNFNISLIKVLLSYFPAIILGAYIAFNPMGDENHLIMSNFLQKNFNELCYMSCALLKTKSSIYDQFTTNLDHYSFEVFFRYFLIILIGFAPLFILALHSSFKEKDLLFFKNFKNLLIPLVIILSPITILFAMAYDWGRYLNIGYVFSILFYLNLYKKNILVTNKVNSNHKILKIFNNKKFFIVFFIVYCFGWNHKTVITGDIASFPGYRIPYKVIKIINYKYLKTSNY